MKKMSEKYHLGFFIVFIFLCVIEITLIIYAIMHPRVQNIVLVLIAGLLIFLNRRWMNKVKYVKLIRLLPLFLATLFFGYLAYFVGSFINILFPAHMPYEYKSDIAKFKEKYFDAYYFFPDEIPKDAENIKWLVLPSFMQGSGTEVLIFDAPKEYIQEVIAAYGQDAQICGIEEDMSFKVFYDDTRLEKLTIYKIYDNDDRNHVHIWGFFVDDGIGRIGFFSQ